MYLLRLPLAELLLIVWAVFTSVLLLLLIWRGVIAMHEDDCLFLDDAEEYLRKEQAEVQMRLKRLTPYIQTLSAISGALILVIAGIWVYRGFVNF